MKVALVREKPSTGWKNPDHAMSVITMALPYFQGSQRRYVHRIRSGVAYEWKKGDAGGHLAFKFWCGATGYTSKKMKGHPIAEVSDNAVLCATCEGRAIGAGLEGTRKINGRFVCYQPQV